MPLEENNCKNQESKARNQGIIIKEDIDKKITLNENEFESPQVIPFRKLLKVDEKELK